MARFVLIVALLVLTMISAVSAFRRPAFVSSASSTTRRLATITKGVDFNTIAREWRLKWSPEEDKKSLAQVQQTLNIFAAGLKGIKGVKSVQRIVCGGCNDYKVIVALDAGDFGAWEQKQFAPEADFLAAVKAISGVTQIETQTYTIENV